MPIVLEKARLNLWNLAGFVFLAVGGAFSLGGVYVSISRDVAEIRETQVSTRATNEKNFEDLEKQITPIPQLVFGQSLNDKRIEELRAQIADTNKRFDRMIELVSGKLDGLGENLNSLRTEVRVLAQEVRSNAERPKPATYQR